MKICHTCFNVIQEVKIYFSPDRGGFPLCKYGKAAGQITILPFLGFTLFEKCKNSVSPPSSTLFKYTEKAKALASFSNPLPCSICHT